MKCPVCGRGLSQKYRNGVQHKRYLKRKLSRYMSKGFMQSYPDCIYVSDN